MTRMRCCEVSALEGICSLSACHRVSPACTSKAGSIRCTLSCVIVEALQMWITTLKWVRSAGVDWGAVENFVDLKDQLAEFAQIDKEGVDTPPM